MSSSASTSVAAAGTPGEAVTGEVRRTIDDRWRLSLPSELAPAVVDERDETVIVKERYGCLSLWRADRWQAKFDAGLAIIRQKIAGERLADQASQIQRLGRLASTRASRVRLSGRNRLLLPDGVRDFLGVPAGGEVVVVGAFVTVELWNPEMWVEQLREDMPSFNELFLQLSS